LRIKSWDSYAQLWVAIRSLEADVETLTSLCMGVGEATALVPKLEFWKLSTPAGANPSGAPPRVNQHTQVVAIGSLAAAGASRLA
jgi:hypothetical protein